MCRKSAHGERRVPRAFLNFYMEIEYVGRRGAKLDHDEFHSQRLDGNDRNGYKFYKYRISTYIKIQELRIGIKRIYEVLQDVFFFKGND